MSTAGPHSSGASLHANAAWNLLGLTAPVAVALYAVPRLLSGVGADAFGLLMLAWSLLGYFSLLDLGLGRALAQITASRLATAREEEMPACFWTSLHLMALMGAMGAIVLALTAGWLSRHVLKLPPALEADARRSLYLLGASIPILTVSAGLRGFLEAHGRFAALSAIRVGMAVLSFGAPVLLLPYSRSVTVILAVLVLTRILALATCFALCLATTPSLGHVRGIELQKARLLLRLGGWMTVSNVVSPVMTYLDRFLIGGLLSVSAVAYYATPFEAATKLLLIPGALTGVLFPAFSGALASESGTAAALYRRSLALVASILLPCSLVMAGAGKIAIAAWLGTAFAGSTQHVLPILSFGVFVNGVAGIPFALIQAAGRPDLTAKLHLIELPVFLTAAWCLTQRFGIDGTAMAWTLRALIDTVALMVLARPWAAGEKPHWLTAPVLQIDGSGIQ